jgi:maleylacetate reductase
MSAASWAEGVFLDAFEFRYPPVSAVTFGHGVLATHATQQLQRWDVRAAIVVTSRTLAQVPEIDALLGSLRAAGIRASVFSEDMRHCPMHVARQLAGRVRAQGAQALVAVGGSSVSDTAKAAMLLDSLLPGREDATVAQLAAAIDAQRELKLRLLAAPTTLSGGEFTPVVGISDAGSGHKAVLRHPQLPSGAIVLDAALQRHTPDALWASTAFKLIDHAVERILARNHRPLVDAQCVCGLQWLLPVVRHSVGGGESVAAARARLLQVLWVIQSSHGNVGTGLSHALAHQLGTACGLDHGWGSSICLPPTLRLLRDSGRVRPERAAVLAHAFGVPPATDAIAGVLRQLDALRQALALPANLADAGVTGIDIAHVAQAALDDPTTRSSPGEPFTPAEVRTVLESAR